MEQLKNGQAYLALPPTGSGAGVILLHAWWGLTDFFKATADRLANEGFVVLAPDLYHGATAATIEEAAKLSDGLDMGAAVELIKESADFLAVHAAVTGSELGIIGFSLGAGYAVWMSNLLPDTIGAVVLFYDAYCPDLSAAKAAFQGHYAETDAYCPREDVEKLEATLNQLNLEANFFVYSGTTHWFFEADRPAYHPESARLAWEWTVKFLHEKL